MLAGRFKAAIDVFPTEPLAHDHPIQQAPGAVLSAPAGSVKERLWAIEQMVVDDLEAIHRAYRPSACKSLSPS